MHIHVVFLCRVTRVTRDISSINVMVNGHWCNIMEVINLQFPNTSILSPQKECLGDGGSVGLWNFQRGGGPGGRLKEILSIRKL